MFESGSDACLNLLHRGLRGSRSVCLNDSVLLAALSFILILTNLMH